MADALSATTASCCETASGVQRDAREPLRGTTRPFSTRRSRKESSAWLSGYPWRSYRIGATAARIVFVPVGMRRAGRVRTIARGRGGGGPTTLGDAHVRRDARPAAAARARASVALELAGARASDEPRRTAAGESRVARRSRRHQLRLKSAVPRSTTQGGANKLGRAPVGASARRARPYHHGHSGHAARRLETESARTVRDLPVASLDDRVDCADARILPSPNFPAQASSAGGTCSRRRRRRTPRRNRLECPRSVCSGPPRAPPAGRPRPSPRRPAHRGRRLVSARRPALRPRPQRRRARLPPRTPRRDACLSRLPARRRTRRSRRRTRARRPPRGRRLLAVRFPRRARRAGRREPPSRGTLRRRCAAERFGSREDVFHQTLRGLSQVAEPIVHRRAFERGVRERERRGTRRLRSSRAGRKSGREAGRGRRASAAGFGPPVAANPFAAAAKAAARTSAHRAEPLADRRGRRK